MTSKEDKIWIKKYRDKKRGWYEETACIVPQQTLAT